ncbi:MAG: hypothetical protein CL677_04090 [Bdellovibrionaceae bacterium]|nr:hypothetical protein [Pseudobdellovibrionaceae bacterium]|tara:strand:+ start:51509 stop:52177 length:669 start_codon:yes stop_codon:yes gene_type:complete
MNLKYLAAFFVFLVGGMFGHRIAINSWDGLVYVYVQHDGNRYPAAVESKYDFSNLRGSALDAASQRRLLSHAKMVTQPGQIGIELGHFVQRGNKGLKEFACNSFDSVEMEFRASNMMVSGSVPTMKIEGSCKFTKTLDRIDPIWIPISKIKTEKPGNSVLEYWENERVTVSFENMGGEWPESWELHSARLYKKGGGEQIRVTSKEIDKILKGDPIQIHFDRF